MIKPLPTGTPKLLVFFNHSPGDTPGTPRYLLSLTITRGTPLGPPIPTFFNYSPGDASGTPVNDTYSSFFPRLPFLPTSARSGPRYTAGDDITSCGGFRRLGGGASSEPRRVCRVDRRVGSSGNSSAVLRRPALGLCVGGGPQARPQGRGAGDSTGGCAASSSSSSSLSRTLLFRGRPRFDFF